MYMHDIEQEVWLFEEVCDHVGMYGSKVAEGLSAFNVGLVVFVLFVSNIKTTATLELEI